MKPLHFYLGGTGAWYLAWGIQGVTFAWLLTIELRLAPDLVGIAQMALMLPTLLLMLVGGSIADHFGGKPIAVVTQTVVALGPVYLIVLLMTDGLSYGTILGFAIYAGCIQAILTPSRDGLLAAVAEGRLQRRVMQVSMAQWGLQMIGVRARVECRPRGPGTDSGSPGCRAARWRRLSRSPEAANARSRDYASDGAVPRGRCR